MDRPEPGLIKWSPNPSVDSFLHINLQHRKVQIYKPTGHAQRGRFDFERLSKHDDFPPLTTYDWSPTIPGLIAVGTSTGVVNLLRVDDNSNDYLELNLKMSRICQAVAFSTSNMLAVGLDRVRSDRCLYIWDVNRLSGLDSSSPGFPSGIAPFTDPSDYREPSVSVSSVKFFEDNPNTLVVGIKGQGLRIHDLRDSTPSPSVGFQTKCNNNLSIDYADQNYFASSALDQPGVLIWDRRATGGRAIASPTYLDALELDDLPWGSALRIDHSMELEPDAALSDNKNSFIRSLRYCRDHRGLLAVLSRTGQLKIFDTTTEYSSLDIDVEGSPKLLHVRKSNEMDTRYADYSRKNDRIVSFDWVTMGSPVLQPRLLVLRANGALEILEKPSHTMTYAYKLVPWMAPFRGLEEGTAYHGLMEFEPSQADDILGPLAVENLLSDIAVFGPDKPDVDDILDKAQQGSSGREEVVVDLLAKGQLLPASVSESSTVAAKLRALRKLAREQQQDESPKAPKGNNSTDALSRDVAAMKLSARDPQTNQELHDALLTSTLKMKGLPLEAHKILDHVMLLRAKEKYLFDCEVNRRVVSDDPWLRDVWAWIAGAEEAVADGGMISHPLDLGYMGVATVWMNDLGNDKSTRLPEGSTSTPDVSVWERSINAISKKRGIQRFDGVETKKPHHRQLCLDICAFGRNASSDLLEYEEVPISERTTTYHTMSAAHALFMGDLKQAVQILKTASTDHPELLFVSLALQLINKGDGGSLVKEQLDFDEAVASKTDPYLRAISSLIATTDWATIANQKSLPLRERIYVAVRNFDDEQLTQWLRDEVDRAVETGDIEGIVLTGITDGMVDILAKYVEKFHDVQTATLIMSFCAPRYLDDYRCTAWRTAYRAYLQRHKAFFQRTKFEVESTKRSKRDGRPTIKPPFRQIALRCVYCDVETRLAGPSSAAATQLVPSSADKDNLLPSKLVVAGVSCPNCKRQLPRCVVCLEVVGMPRSDKPEASTDPEARLAARFPTFCLKCEHVLHLDHARQWFARHAECPVPECRCRCNFRANPELNYQ